MATAIGDLVARLRMDTRGFRGGASDAIFSLNRVIDRVYSAQKSFITMGAKSAGAMVAVGAAIAAWNVKEQLAQLHDLASQAQTLGISSGALAELQHAAVMTNTDVNALSTGMEKLLKNIAETNAGLGESRLAFAALRLDTTELAKLSPDRMFGTVADAIAHIENPTERMVVMMKIFGESGAKLENVLALGSKGIAGMSAEARTLGLALNDIDAGSVAKANEELARASEAMKGAWRTLTVELAPALETLAKTAAGLAKDLRHALAGETYSTRQSELAQRFQEHQLGRPLREGEPISLKNWRAAGAFLQGMNRLGEALRSQDNMAKDAASSAITYADAVRAQGEAARLAAAETAKHEAAVNKIVDRERAATEARLQPIRDAADVLSKWRFDAFTQQNGLTDRQAQIEQLRRGGADPIQLEWLNTLDAQLTELTRKAETVDLAKSLNDQFRDPIEKYAARVAEIDRAAAAVGGLGAGVRDRAIQAARDEFLDAPKDFSQGARYSGAMQKGSAEAYSTILNAGKESDKIAGKHLRVGELQLQVLGEIRREVGKGSETVSIPSA